MRMTKFLLIGLLFICATAFQSCKKSNPRTDEVFIRGNGTDGYNPTSITVARGTTITWSNKTGDVHTVTSDNGKFDSGDMSAGSQFVLTFSNPGSYPYHCKYHSMMKG